MADLKREDRRPFVGARGGERNRGQVLLIAGFVLAVAFLAVAVMLNGVIYSENLATRGEDARGSEAIAYQADVVDGAEQLIESANENQSTFDERTTAFNQSVTSMYNDTALMQAVDGIATDVSVIGVTNGTHIGQFNASRNFTNNDGDPNWKLAEDIHGTRAFRIDVTDQTALSGGGGNFSVNVTNGTDTWTAEIYGDANSTTIDVVGGGACTVGPTPEIDLTAGTVNATPCDALAFGSGVSEPYSIEFENANAIAGNFSLVVNSTSYDSVHYNSDRDSPFVEEGVIYSSTLHLRHESPDHVYATEADVVPGENDA